MRSSKRTNFLVTSHVVKNESQVRDSLSPDGVEKLLAIETLSLYRTSQKGNQPK